MKAVSYTHLLRALAGHPFALALPAVANADVLEGVRAWARTVGGQLTAVYACLLYTSRCV